MATPGQADNLRNAGVLNILYRRKLHAIFGQTSLAGTTTIEAIGIRQMKLFAQRIEL
ncbi:hypothetical protein JHK87_001649 [Glycine soja]|nr:hypothetical protein JHK87_001649 [Glycine soja]